MDRVRLAYKERLRHFSWLRWVVVVLGDVVMTLFVMVKKKKGCGRKGLKEEEEDGFVLVFTRCYFYLFFF